jgi:hypothetical protein
VGKEEQITINEIFFLTPSFFMYFSHQKKYKKHVSYFEVRWLGISDSQISGKSSGAVSSILTSGNVSSASFTWQFPNYSYQSLAHSTSSACSSSLRFWPYMYDKQTWLSEFHNFLIGVPQFLDR